MKMTKWFHDAREMLEEAIQYRELLFQMTQRDLLIRYKSTVMGFGWAISMPVLNVLIFTVIFTRVAPLNIDVPYPIYAYAGLLPWNLFASAVRFAIPSLSGNANLVTKVYFPREIFPFSAVLVCLVDFGIASTVLAAMMIYYRFAVSWTILFLPVLLVVQLAFTAGIALLAAMANLFLRDVKYLSELGLSLWMFATSVVYPVDRVHGTLGSLLKLNPMTPLIDSYRAILLRGQLPEPGTFLWVAALSFVVLALGWFTFHQAESTFAENV
jgi:lipopolysaccharide transport system permease protein